MDNKPVGRPHRIFNHLWGASGFSNLADGIGLTAAPLLAAMLTRDPLLVSGLTIAQRLPWFLFTLVSGAVVDRLDRREVMEKANLWRFFILGCLALAVLTNQVSLLFLYLLYFLLGTIETLFDNAALAILPAIVEQERLEDSNGRLFATATVTNELLGPPLGSILFTTFQPISFLAASAAYGLSSLLMHRIPGSFTPTTRQRENLYREIEAGVRWFWRHRLLRALGFFAATFNFVSGATLAIFVLFAQDVLGLSEAAYGFILAFGAIGGILGSVLARQLSDRFGAGLILLTDAIISGIAFLVIGLTSRPAIVGFMFVLISMSNMFGNVIIISLRQAIIPDDLLGRVASTYRLLVLGALPLGAFFGGMAAKAWDLHAPFLLGGGLLIFTGLMMQPAINNRTIKSARELAG